MPVTATHIKRAQAKRDRRLQQAKDAYAESVRKANAEFAAEVRRELDSSPERKITHVANDLGCTRQTIHDLLRRYPAAA